MCWNTHWPVLITIHTWRDACVFFTLFTQTRLRPHFSCAPTITVAYICYGDQPLFDCSWLQPPHIPVNTADCLSLPSSRPAACSSFAFPSCRYLNSRISHTTSCLWRLCSPCCNTPQLPTRWRQTHVRIINKILDRYDKKSPHQTNPPTRKRSHEIELDSGPFTRLHRVWLDRNATRWWRPSQAFRPRPERRDCGRWAIRAILMGRGSLRSWGLGSYWHMQAHTRTKP